MEPSVDVVMEELLPKMFCMKMFTVLLDSNASEHAARTMACLLYTSDIITDKRRDKIHGGRIGEINWNIEWVR